MSRLIDVPDSLAVSVKTLIKVYNDAVNNELVRKPISYALYQTWKVMDEIEKERNQT